MIHSWRLKKTKNPQPESSVDQQLTGAYNENYSTTGTTVNIHLHNQFVWERFPPPQNIQKIRKSSLSSTCLKKIFFSSNNYLCTTTPTSVTEQKPYQ